MRRFGFHVSISGGIYRAPEFALAEGYGTFQFFPTSSRAWTVKKPSDDDSMKFASIVGRNGIIPFAHIPYLCNPASPEKEVLEKSKRLLVESMEICREAKTEHIVVHLGSHKGAGLEKGMENIRGTLTHALDSVKHVGILLENTSGYRNSIGSKMSEIGAIVESVKSSRIGLCFDTCHAFAAGYDIRSQEGVDRVVEEIGTYIGKERLGLVHLNDAKYPLGSGLDRHWHIGKGYIGKDGFANMFRNRLFGSGNFVMETPVNEEGDDRTNMEAVAQILKSIE